MNRGDSYIDSLLPWAWSEFNLITELAGLFEVLFLNKRFAKNMQALEHELRGISRNPRKFICHLLVICLLHSISSCLSRPDPALPAWIDRFALVSAFDSCFSSFTTSVEHSTGAKIHFMDLRCAIHRVVAVAIAGGVLSHCIVPKGLKSNKHLSLSLKKQIPNFVNSLKVYAHAQITLSHANSMWYVSDNPLAWERVMRSGNNSPQHSVCHDSDALKLLNKSEFLVDQALLAVCVAAVRRSLADRGYCSTKLGYDDVVSYLHEIVSHETSDFAHDDAPVAILDVQALLVSLKDLLALQSYCSGEPLKVFFRYFFDFRGRVYCDSPVGYTLNKFARYSLVLPFYPTERIAAYRLDAWYAQLAPLIVSWYPAARTDFMVKVIIDSLLILGKSLKSQKEEWTAEEFIREGYTLLNSELSELDIGSFVEVSYYSTAIEQVLQLNNSNRVFFKDATAAGTQLLAAILSVKDKKMLRGLNLTDSAVSVDSYAWIIREFLSNSIPPEYGLYFGRKALKPTIMLLPYKASYVTCTKTFRSSHPDFCVLEKRKTALHVYKACYKTLNHVINEDSLYAYPVSELTGILCLPTSDLANYVLSVEGDNLVVTKNYLKVIFQNRFLSKHLHHHPSANEPRTPPTGCKLIKFKKALGKSINRLSSQLTDFKALRKSTGELDIVSRLKWVSRWKDIGFRHSDNNHSLDKLNQLVADQIRRELKKKNKELGLILDVDLRGTPLTFGDGLVFYLEYFETVYTRLDIKFSQTELEFFESFRDGAEYVVVVDNDQWVRYTVTVVGHKNKFDLQRTWTASSANLTHMFDAYIIRDLIKRLNCSCMAIHDCIGLGALDFCFLDRALIEVYSSFRLKVGNSGYWLVISNDFSGARIWG